MKGRNLGLSVPRRLIAEHLRLSQGVPTCALVATLELAGLVAARAAAPLRPPWTAIFAKAQALAAREVPALRQVFVKLPWPQLYELPSSTAAIVVERDFAGEPALFYARIRSPETMPLPEIGARILHAKTAPLAELKDFRVARMVARLPLPLRRMAIWTGRNIGRQVPRHFGTFGISTVVAEGIAFPAPLSPWTSFLIYGPIGRDGRLEMNMTFDHRVLDGSHAVAAFRALQAALAGPVLAELRALNTAES